MYVDGCTRQGMPQPKVRGVRPERMAASTAGVRAVAPRGVQAYQKCVVAIGGPQSGRKRGQIRKNHPCTPAPAPSSTAHLSTSMTIEDRADGEPGISESLSSLKALSIDLQTYSAPTQDAEVRNSLLNGMLTSINAQCSNLVRGMLYCEDKAGHGSFHRFR